MKRIIPPVASNATGEPAANLIEVLLFLIERQAIPSPNLAELRTLAEGARVDLQARRIGAKTRKLIQLVKRRLSLAGTAGEVDQTTAEALNRLLEDNGAIEPEPVSPAPAPADGSAQQRAIGGTVLLDDGTPAAGLELRLYQIAFGAEGARIGQTAVGESGAYAFSYPPPAKAAALQIRAAAPDGGEVSLTRPLLDLAENEQVDLVAPVSLLPVGPEFARLNVDLMQAAGGIDKLAAAREDDERQDVTLLNRATGWDGRIIALASKAAQLSTDGLPLSHEATYGLLRAGLPSSKDQLVRVDPAAVELALTKAAADRVVDLGASEIKQAVASFTDFAASARLDQPAPGSASTFRDLLGASGIGEAAQKKFAGVLAAPGADGAEIWDKAREAGISAADIGKLKTSGKLNFLTLNNHSLASNLREAGIAEPAELVDSKLDRPEAWEERLRAMAGNSAEALAALVPPAYAGESLDARVSAYAADMARKVRIAYPGHVVAASIERDTGDGLGLGVGRTMVARLLKQSADAGFTLGAHPPRKFVEANPGVLDGIPAADRDMALAGLAQVQRVYQIAPGAEAMNTLASLGLTSAFDVTALSEAQFLERFGPRFRSPQEAQLVYRKAQQVSSVTYNLFTIARKLDGDVPMYGLSAAPEGKDEAKDALIKQFPTMESLFGSMDFCECEHCRSVLSPAAYLVDIMQFLDPEALVWENFLADWKTRHGGDDYLAKYVKPYDALIERRPDLQHIKLTCENTNTALPYIDIVNEILEYYVANGALDGGAARDTGALTTADLLAEPQNVIAQAYKALRSELYPAPFDLWLETLRGFCGQFDVPLSELLETFQRSDELFDAGTPLDRAAILLESLGLSPAEAAIFRDPDPLRNWFELFGYDAEPDAMTEARDPGEQRIDLNSAKALSRRLDVTYQELADLVETEFVNPALGGLAYLYRLGLRTADIFTYRDGKALYEADKDLLGVDRATLSAAKRARFDALSEEDWATLHETAAFVDRLAAYAAEFPIPADLRKTVDDGLADGSFEHVLVLADPDAGCDFDQTILRYASGDAADAAVFLRINLFVRLWRKLGWSIAETDQALGAFVPKAAPFVEANFAKLPLQSALIAIAHVKQIERRIRMGENGRARLLALWSPVLTGGPDPLYAQLFLSGSKLARDPAFDDPLGQYLSAKPPLAEHMLALQAALGMSAGDIRLVLLDGAEDLDQARLTIETVSLLSRYAFLSRALGLKVPELITLKSLSGLDPFASLPSAPLATAADDVLWSQTLAFLDQVDALKASSFKADELDFLLRHRFDAAGKLRPDANAALAFIRTVALALRAIESEQSLPGDAASVSDDALRQKLGLILAPNLVNALSGMLAGTVVTIVSRSGVAQGAALTLAQVGGEREIVAAAYDPVHKQQSLSVRGVLFDEARDLILGRLKPSLSAARSALLKSLLKDVQHQQRALFDTALRKSGTQPATGFLDDADFAGLFRPLNNLPPSEMQERMGQRRGRLIEAFLPYLRERLAGQAVLDLIGAELGTEPAMTEALAIGAVAGSSGLTPAAAFGALGARGASAAFFQSSDLSGEPLAEVARAADIDTKASVGNAALMPEAARSARFAAYFEVPERGDYRFSVMLDKKNAKATVRFGHRADPLFSLVASAAGDEVGEFLPLEPGRLYRLELDLEKLGGGGARLMVQGTTLPKGSILQLAPYPAQLVEDAAAALMRARKTLRIATLLQLGPAELHHFATHPAAFDGLDLGLLPTGPGEGSIENARLLFKPLTRLAAYARLKSELGAGEDLIEVLAASTPAQRQAALAVVTRRDPAKVRQTAELLWDDPQLATEADAARLWRALRLAERFGVADPVLAEWTRIVDPAASSEQCQAIALGAKAALRSRFEEEAWRKIAQPVHDRLRQRQRDALVAYVCHKKSFARIEQLYEHFLIDPAMEPVVQTSRIRLASGSVQLFIHRCLLNLEKKVPPSALDAKQWEWMSRYRVWEANRKIFLFPENWLEPEFRTGKTHLFAELEGALLQGDVSADLAEDALFTYLEKLDELARLELVGLHVEDDPDPAERRLHLLGRTHGIPHKYFYRRLAHGAWTPWEAVTPKIDGDHIAPVVWRNRLYLFWVTFELRGAAPGDKQVNAPPIRIEAPRQEVDVKLHWASYLKGKWSAPEASEPMTVIKQYSLAPMLPGLHGASGSYPVVLSFPLLVGPEFDPVSVPVHVSKEPYEDGEERGVLVHLGGEIQQTIYLAGRHATAELRTASEAPVNPLSASSTRATRYQGSGTLSVTFRQRIQTEQGGAVTETRVSPAILGLGGSFSILPCNSRVTLGMPDLSAATDPAAVAAAAAASLQESADLSRPFFYQDQRIALLALPDVAERTVETWEQWVQPQPPANPHWTVPEWWKDIAVAPARPVKGVAPIDPSHFVTHPGGIMELPSAKTGDWLTDAGTAVHFGGQVIGARGSADAAVANGFSYGGPRIAIADGVVHGGDAAGLAVIGGDGLTPILANRFERIR